MLKSVNISFDSLTDEMGSRRRFILIFVWSFLISQNSITMKKQLLMFGMLFGFVLFLAACGNTESTEATTDMDATEEPAAEPAPAEDAMDAESTEATEGGNGTEVQ
jgi:hypothetical protein